MKHSQLSAQSERFQALHFFLKDLLIYYLEVGVTESEGETEMFQLLDLVPKWL